MSNPRTTQLLIALLGLALPIWLMAGCNDYDLVGETGGYQNADDDDTAGDDDDASAGDDDVAGDDDTAGDDDDDAAGDDDDDDTGSGNCGESAEFSWDDPDGDGWLVVLSWSPDTDYATLYVTVSGNYAIYDEQLAESGSSQMNETGYITVTNSINPAGNPLFTNCGGVLIVQDPDNNGTPASAQYLGTFPLVAGEANELTLRHACPMMRNGLCTNYEIDPGGGTSCASGDANSLHMTLDGICLEPV